MMRFFASAVPLALVELFARTAGYFGRLVKPTWEADLASRIRGLYWGCYFGTRGLSIGQQVVIEGRSQMTIGPGVKLFAGVQLVAVGAGRLEIGEGTNIARATMVSAPGGVTIGARCDISSHVSIYSVSADGRLPEPFDGMIRAPVTIGDGVLIGTGARILPGVTIGRQATIGAGAVVTSDIPPGAIAVGVPARVISTKPGTDEADP